MGSRQRKRHPHRPYAAHSNTLFMEALRELLGLGPLPKTREMKARTAPTVTTEHSVTESTLQDLDAPELIEERDAERDAWIDPGDDRTERRGPVGWFGGQRRRGSGVCLNKPRPNYRGGWPKRQARKTPP